MTGFAGASHICVVKMGHKMSAKTDFSILSSGNIIQTSKDGAP